MRFAYRSLVPVVLFISLLVSSCPFCGLTDWEIDENPCFFYPCSGGDTCFVVNDQPTCGNCESDEDCTLACEDNRCVECLDASDCGDDAYCDGTCVFVGCDGNDDACASSSNVRRPCHVAEAPTGAARSCFRRAQNGLVWPPVTNPNCRRSAWRATSSCSRLARSVARCSGAAAASSSSTRAIWTA